tara:strand:- start:107 stop:1204 length:1098 start_codon:yes stop_codon:yes gene_type:complete
LKRSLPGRQSVLKYRGEKCQNCHIPLEKSDQFCPNCGQINSTKKLTFDDFFNEFFSGLLAYDSRFQRTLRVMLFKPGKISRDYIDGKRMRYANPFRFYLSASIIFFLLFNYSIHSENDMIGPRDRDMVELAGKTPPIPPEALDSVNAALAKENLSLDKLKLDTVQKTYKDYYISQETVDTMSNFSALFKKFNLYYEFQGETGIATPDRALDSLKHDQTNYNHWLYKKAVDANVFKNNPGLFIDYFISKLPFIIFFYLPVFALFIWLLYMRRNFNYMEHLIFAFHVQTTLFVFYIVGLTFDLIASLNVGITLANIVFAVYLYKSMRNFYRQRRVKTILKFIILNLIFFTLATIAVFISLLASFSIY